MNKVPCACQVCLGKLVSRHVRRRHAEVYRKSAFSHPTPALPDKLKLPVGSPLNSALQREGSLCTASTLPAPQATVECSGTDADQEGPGAALPEPENEASCGGGDSDCDEHPAKRFRQHLYFDSTLYEEGAACTPLYDGSPVTVLETLVHYFSWFSEHPGISKEALSSVLSLQHNSILPPGNQLPDSYDAAIQIIEPYLVKSTIYHVCPNDCVIFRGANAQLTECPVCHSARYKQGTTIPVRTYTYLPLGPRLARLYGTPNLAQLVQSHGGGREERELKDVHDSVVWRQAYGVHGVFGGEVRGLSLAFCSDGMNPFKHNKVSYSMWPVMLTILNLPRNIRNHFGNILLVGIIPGNGSKEPDNLDPYLDIFVDEILELSGSTVYDTYQKAPFSCKVELLMHILDYPGICKVFRITGSGAYNACAWCHVQGDRYHTFQRLYTCKTRDTFLKHHHSVKMTSTFPKKKAENRDPPETKSYASMKSYHSAYDNAKNRSQADAIAKSTSCKGNYSLMRLPTHDRVSQTVPDVMHIVKDVVEGIFHLVTGRDDTEKVRRSEASIGRFGLESADFSTCSSSTNGPIVPPYRLSPKKLQVAQERSDHLMIPSHVDFDPQDLFRRSSRLKSHDWKQIATHGALKYCFRDMLGDKQRHTLFYFFDTLQAGLDECIKVDCLPELKEQMHTALALLERDFPVALQDITVHLLHHIVEGLERYGPVYTSWMYHFERFNSWMCRRALNRFRPEATVMETYRVYEWCNYMALAGRVPDHDGQMPITCTLPPEGFDNDHNQEQLQESDFELLQIAYKEKFSLYSCLCSQYMQAKQRALNAHTGSLFPSKDTWNPPDRVLSACEREALCGPSNLVKVYKRVVLNDAHTGRSIEYRSILSEVGLKYCNSYVEILQEGSTTPIIGSLKAIYSQSFLGQSSFLAKVTVFDHVSQDEQSRLWRVSLTHATHNKIVLMSQLSKPLIVAREDTTLWIIDL